MLRVEVISTRGGNAMSVQQNAGTGDAAQTLGGPTLPQRRNVVTEIPGPVSRALLERKRSAVASGVGITLPVFTAAAGGGILLDVDGNSLIDFGSGIAVTGVGNAAPGVVDAVSAQAALFTHTCFSITGYDGYVEVAEALNRLTPGDHEKRSALFNSGAEAVENAIKIARHFTGRQGVVAFDHGYHGRTNLTMALTAKSMPYKSGFGPFAPEIYRMPTSYPYRDGGLSGEAAAAIAITQIEKQVGAANLAAIIIEPIQGEGGFVVPANGYLTALAKWATTNGVVFIADEVQTGFARTGVMFACEHEGVVPDLIVTAKGIAGGLPLSAVTGRAAIMDSAHVGGLGGTYGGNPLACAAALASIDAYENGGLVERARAIGDLMIDRLTALAATDARIGDVRGRGAMIAIELVDEKGEPDAALTSRVAAYAHAAGVILLTCGTYGNVVRFLPPLAISDELLHEGLDVVAEALAATLVSTETAA
jgi:4-aminobutyrate aminotransferase/(S)-3-amino-2-methylpropionate transaminase